MIVRVKLEEIRIFLKSWSALEGVTLAYSLLVLTVFLLSCGPEGYRHIMEWKFGLFAGLCGGYILVMAGIGLWGAVKRRASGKGGDAWPPAAFALWKRSSWVQRFAVLYLLVTWGSALCSPYWPETVVGVSRYEGALSITLYVVSFLLVSIYGRARPVLLWTGGVVLALFCGLCLVQFTGANPFGLFPEGLSYLDAYKAYSGAYLGTIGNVDLVGAFLSLAVPLLVYALLRLQNRRRFWLVIPLGLCLWVLIRMSVTAGFVGVGLGCALAFPVAGLTKKRSRLAAAGCLCVLALLGLGTIYYVDGGGELFHQLHQILHGQIEDSFGTGRVYVWRQVLQRVPEHPLLGFGPDTMWHSEMAFHNYNPVLGRMATSRIDTAHNEYLNVLYHQGLLGLGTFSAMLAALAADWIKSAPDSPVAAMLGAGLLGYCVQAFFSFSMPITAPFFWLAAGLLAASSPKGTAPSAKFTLDKS